MLFQLSRLATLLKNTAPLPAIQKILGSELNGKKCVSGVPASCGQILSASSCYGWVEVG